ncbi:MAG: HEPN domain-containing protein [Woronichinia naegeliana WA131]|uniref:HEPN domain-containing protein n=1 Tax=Woronichinia naegeliana WA131 TaxID=2824559 RepID=A0A977L279_9CYAN|nr:MAG: HEPN domain-containing protein [Woronichinia naegeliana WA131]
MDDAHYHEIQQWLLKSQRDLEAAKVLFEHGLFDVVVYHCQQSAEKALKAYLVYQEVILQKTHNLVVLLESCLAFDINFEILRDSAEILTPYATEFRYPGDTIEPEKYEAEEALAIASLVLDFVVKLLPNS